MQSYIRDITLVTKRLVRLTDDARDAGVIIGFDLQLATSQCPGVTDDSARHIARLFLYALVSVQVS